MSQGSDDVATYMGSVDRRTEAKSGSVAFHPLGRMLGCSSQGGKEVEVWAIRGRDETDKRRRRRWKRRREKESRSARKEKVRACEERVLLRCYSNPNASLSLRSRGRRGASSTTGATRKKREAVRSYRGGRSRASSPTISGA